MNGKDLAVEPQPVWPRVEKFLTRNRIRLSLLIIAVFVYKDIKENVRPHDIFDLKDAWGLAGLLLVAAGVALRSWAAGIIHKSKSLATTGPYSLTRHPLYTGSLLLALGFCTIIGKTENFFVLLGIAILFYMPKIHREEVRLSNMFGAEWGEYVSRTAICFPRKSPDLRSDWSLRHWFRNGEYSAFLTCLAALIILKLIHEYPIADMFVSNFR